MCWFIDYIKFSRYNSTIWNIYMFKIKSAIQGMHMTCDLWSELYINTCPSSLQSDPHWIRCTIHAAHTLFTQYTISWVRCWPFIAQKLTKDRTEGYKTVNMVFLYSCSLALLGIANEQVACKRSRGWLYVTSMRLTMNGEWPRDNK